MSNLAGNGAAPERVANYMVTPNFFALVGARPALGRTFAPEEDQPRPRAYGGFERRALETPLRRRSRQSSAAISALTMKTTA